MVQRASYNLHTAALCEEFGREWAEKVFGEETIAALPLFERGRNKGKLKGYINWRKVLSGGWDREQGGVVRGGVVEAWITNSRQDPPTNAVTGIWLGQTRVLRLSKDELFEEGRARSRQLLQQLHQDQYATALVEAEEHGITDGILGTTRNRYASLEATFPGVSAAWEKGRQMGASIAPDVPEHQLKIYRRMAERFHPPLPEETPDA